MNFLLIIVIVIFIGLMLNGYRQGLLKAVLSVGAVVLALFLTSHGYPYVSKAIRSTTNLESVLKEKITVSLEMKVEEEISTKNQQMELIDQYNLPEQLKTILIDNNNNDIYEQLQVNNFYDYVGSILSCIIINGIAYLATWLILFFIIRVVMWWMDIMTDFPLVHGVDKAGGVVLGLAEAAIIVWLGFILITIIGNSQIGETLYGQICENPFLTFLYQHNILLDIVTNISESLF